MKYQLRIHPRPRHALQWASDQFVLACTHVSGCAWLVAALSLSLSLSCSIASVAGKETGPAAWQPQQGPNAADMIGPFTYLPQARDWERMTVWIPRHAPKEGRLPCIIHVYGGGYNQKGCSARPGEEWLKRGFVVAQPDYMLRVVGPSTACGWDVMHAIRYLRANAERFRIDPERIGLIGFSAGGWIAQGHCYADDGTAKLSRLKTASGGKGGKLLAVPRVPAGRSLADVPSKVQAVVSDWGATHLNIGKNKRGVEQLGFMGHVTADDPPLMTCFPGEPRQLANSSIAALGRVGVPAEPVFLGKIKSTHVPKESSPGKLADGSATTWFTAVGDFFERHVKHPTVATAPEVYPHGGPIPGPVAVRILSVHGVGSVRYTLDGSDPTASSARATDSIQVAPGQTLKAIALREGLKPSRVTTAVYTAGPAAPVITTKQRSFNLEAGKAFTLPLTITSEYPVVWDLLGMTLRPGQKKNEKGWISIDQQTGVLSAPNPRPGHYTVVVVAGPVIDVRVKDAPPRRSTAIQLHFAVGQGTRSP